MKFIVEVEVEAESPSQAVMLVDRAIVHADAYQHIQCWPQSNLKTGEVKPLDN